MNAASKIRILHTQLIKIGRIYVDFNNVVDKHIVLLSREDFSIDSNGEKIELYDGRFVHIYEVDRNDLVERYDLVAEGIVERKSNSATYATTSMALPNCFG